MTTTKLSQQIVQNLHNWDDANIKQKFFNKIPGTGLEMINEIRDSLFKLARDIGRDEYQQWFIVTTENIINYFHQMLVTAFAHDEVEVFLKVLRAFYGYVFFKQESSR